MDQQNGRLKGNKSHENVSQLINKTTTNFKQITTIKTKRKV